MPKSRVLEVVAFICTTLLSPSLANAQNLQPVSVISFPGGSNWPIWIAQEKGYFAQGDIEITLTPTPNSVFQMTSLVEGKFDIATTAFDNVVAYMEGQGEVPLSTQPDLFVVMGSTPSMPALTGRPEIKTYQDLKGKKLAADALTTGYAFILFDLLKRNGLNLGDYEVDNVGGTPARLQGMREGKYAGALMTLPFDLIAKAAGFNVMQYAIDVYGHYQDSIVATRRSWAAANEKKLVAFIKGFVMAVEWLRDPKNKDEAIAIYRKNLPQLSPELAAQIYAAVTGPKGVTPKAQLDIAGIQKLLELRSEYGKPKKILTDPTRYYDLKYYEAALR
jgi:ABC-type nitrate/sulfonate/bicarbonate transport system substrate-binding protein